MRRAILLEFNLLIVLTFVTKVTEDLCSGPVFSLDIIRLFNQPFLTKFFKYHSKGIVVLSSNLKRYFTCDDFSKSYGGLRIANLTNLGQIKSDRFCTINA